MQFEQYGKEQDPLDFQDATQKFEKGRIAVLQQERVYMQKKTFTKWCNSFLEKAHMSIDDLFTDLADGKKLMKLLEIISGEKIGRPNKGVLRVQKMENVSRCLNFLATKVQFENIGAEDIVDNNPRLILGLIWTIILRFQIQDILVDLEAEESGEKRSAKDALLLWCQRKTHGYHSVDIKNFHNSWRNGMGFNALIHAHRPDLIRYDDLQPNQHIKNLNNAFNSAEDQLGIHKLLDAEDVDQPHPDEKSIMTYVAAYYHYFARMKTESVGTKRIAKVMTDLLEMEKMQDDYDTLTTNLLDWIYTKIHFLNDRNFPNSLQGIQQDMGKFKNYRTVEKPPKYRERGNIEAHFFNIQAKLKSKGQRHYMPPEGKLIKDIEIAWGQLEKAEHDRERSLREELIRQERLQQLADKFERKAGLRDSWLNDMTTVLQDQNFGSSTTQVEAALKKHEAIAAEIDTRKDRFLALTNMADELQQENYHSKDKIKQREKVIMDKWRHLMDLLDKKKRILNGYNDLLGMFREIEAIQIEMKDMEPAFRSEDTGKHLLSTEDLLQKHSLMEAQLNALGGRVHNLNKRAQPYMKSLHPETQLLKKRLDQLNKDLNAINDLSAARTVALEEARLFYQFEQDSEEDDAWLSEKIRVMKSQDVGRDLVACMSLIKKHEGLIREMQGRRPISEGIMEVGHKLVANNHKNSPYIQQRLDSLRDKWRKLDDLAGRRRTLLDDALESHQYYADANEAESWMKEKMPLASSQDYGTDEPTATNLLQRHQRLEGEIKSFSTDVDRLQKLSSFMTKDAKVHNIKPEDTFHQREDSTDSAAARPQQRQQPSDDDDEEEEEAGEEWMDVPYQYQVEETRQKEGFIDEVVEKKIPQVKAMYPYAGHGMDIAKGEQLLLLSKANADWWSVRKANGEEGFVPANYIKEVEPKVVKKVVKKPTKVPEKVMVTKTGTRKELVKKKNPKTKRNLKPSSKIRRTPSMRSQANLHFDRENVEQRQQSLTMQYKDLDDQAKIRHQNLEDAIKFFKFCNECDDFDKWMDDKAVILDSKDSFSENMEGVKRKYETLLTDLAANSEVVEDINKMADEMIREGHHETPYVKQRQKDINSKWNDLNKKKMDKEKTLEGASSIELFQNMCDELKDWIREKGGTLDPNDLGKSLDSIQDLMRKHQNLDYELGPIADKLRKMNLLAESVRQSYPDEAGYVDQRENEIMDMWDDLQRKAAEKGKALEDAEEQQKFLDDAKDLNSWLNDTKGKLKEKNTPHDVAEAEDFLKQHADLLDDIHANREKFEKLRALGEAILAKDPNNKEVRDKLRQMEEEQQALEDMWNKKNADLNAAKDLQIFLKEADQIDSVTASHEAFLEFDDLGDTVEQVEALMKRHEDFEHKLLAQDERIKGLGEMADDMIQNGHPDSQMIDDRRNQVIDRRDRVKDKSNNRHNQLVDSNAYQIFNRDADELSDWVKEKYKTATDESYRDLSNLLPKLQKHQAFEAELKANNERLDHINEVGDDMVNGNHYKKRDISKTLDKLNAEWGDLVDKSAEKGKKLREAAQQELFNKALEDADAKLKEMEKSVASDDIGKDLRGVKDLLKKHQMLENEMEKNSENLKEIVDQGHKMAKEGHFDSAGILKKVKDFDKRFNALKDPMNERRKKLEDSNKWHQYNFDADNELLWIKEHMPAATSTDYGKNLIDAQNLLKNHKKFDKEVKGHEPAINKVVDNGDALIASRHFAAPAIKDKKQEVDDAWNDLLQHSADRKAKLEYNLGKQKYLSDANDVESWMNEKMQVVANPDYGKDENAADKLLTNLKSTEGDLAIYDKMLDDLGQDAGQLITADNVQGQEVASKQGQLESEMKKLKGACDDRGFNLEGTKGYHEYMREADDLEEWIGEQMQHATSEEFGTDFEHCQAIQQRFNEFQLGIDAGSERFNRVDHLANRLVEAQNPHSTQIVDRQERVREAWDELLFAVDTRREKLDAAAEIHRFNRDVEDALSRVQEKYTSIPEDLGRDLKAVQAYLKKHEGFENELVALEAQLQVLVDDSSRLEAAYPGGNAEQISQQRSVVLENWAILQEKAAERKDNLNAAVDLYRFMADARDLQAWADQVQTEMAIAEQVSDVVTVDRLRKRHQELKAEIDAREETFASVVEAGKEMIEQGHFASNDIDDTVNALLETREKLHSNWQAQRDHLNELYDQQAFYRDANALDTLSNSQEAKLKSSDVGGTVEQVEALIKRHDAMENLLASQEQKLTALTDYGTRLIDANHFDKENIADRMDSVGKRRAQITDLSADRKRKLDNSLLFSQFNRDYSESQGWIEDRLKNVTDESFSQVMDLHDKMRKLQKHQAFEAEIMANAPSIKKIKEQGEELIRRDHEASPEIQEQVNSLIRQWNDLIQASANRGKGLEEAKDILKFQEEVDKVEAWIRDKELLVSAGDMGRDYEHCLELQKKVNDVEGDVVVDEGRIRAINKLADKLIDQKADDAVEKQKASLNDKWRQVQGDLNEHKAKLAAALEIHSFNRDVDDINDRINEKVFPKLVPISSEDPRPRRLSSSSSPETAAKLRKERRRQVKSAPNYAKVAHHRAIKAMAVSTDDHGKDLEAVQALQRKQEEVERDMTAIHAQLGKLTGQSGKLCKKFPQNAEQIELKLNEAQDNWEKLEDVAQARKKKLEESHQLHKFLTKAKEHIAWCTNMETAMKSSQLAQNVLEADDMIATHQERKAEIDGRYPHQINLKEYGERLVQQKNFRTDEIQKTCKELDIVWAQLNETWEERKQLLTQCYDLQVYEEYAEQADTWLSSKEAFLANNDLGNSMRSVDELMKKHSAFEKTLEAQEEKISTLEQLAQALLAQEHYASEQISNRCDGVQDRHDKVKHMSRVRTDKLEDARNYQQYLRNVYEVLGWINKKHQVAADDSYRDPVNLQGKIQKHTAFEAEIAANKRRKDGVEAEGVELMEASHYASTDIQEKLDILEKSWTALEDQSADKRHKLAEAYQALNFNRQVEDLESWMDDVEGQLASEDHGKDIATVTSLLKRHQLLEDDIGKHQDKVVELMESANNFQRSNHFMSEEILEKAAAANERYQSLGEPCQIRHDNLEDALLLYQYYRDVEDELSWVKDKYPIASSEDLGTTLTQAQNLLKKHQALETEFASHEPLLAKVSNTAHHMVEEKHYAARDVQQRLDDLMQRVHELKEVGAARRVKLLDTVESQTFYSEVAEAESWMNEKVPTLTSTDLGKDEDSVQALQKKLNALDLDIDNFQNTIGELSALSQGLVERGHFDSDNIQQQQRGIEEKYSELRDLAEKRRDALKDNKDLFEYFRECDEVAKWIKEKEAIAASEDYGTDLEHVQILQEKFDDFCRDLKASEERVRKVNVVCDKLVSSRHTQSRIIQERCDTINRMWNDVKELAQARQEALSGAKLVHAFVRDADEAIEWIQEKDLWVSSDDYGQDLETVRSLIVKHDGFEQDLAAISGQVESTTKEAEKLLEQFPDAAEHITGKHEEMVHAWNVLLEKATARKQKLQEAESLQMYFDDYRELRAWCSEMMAIITADDLPRDVSAAEALINRHKEHKTEIDTRNKDINKFIQTGKRLIADGHFLSEEIQYKIEHLNMAWERLLSVWETRRDLYEQNLDVLQLRRDMDQLDSWLAYREDVLQNANVGDSIDAVEELIRKHDDFEKTVEAQEDKFNAIKRLTLLERAFSDQKKLEEQHRLDEEKRRDKERQEEKKRREQDRILEERRREEEQRKAQEMMQKRRREIEESERAEQQRTRSGTGAPPQEQPPPAPEPSRPELTISTRPPLTPTREAPKSPVSPPPPAIVAPAISEPRAAKSPPTSPPADTDAGGLKTTDAWSDAPAKKIQRTDSQKKEKRARSLSMKTRKQTSSFKEKLAPPAEIEGNLERKQELQTGGKKATIRSWRYYYTVLCGHMLCFFKDQQAFHENQAIAPPLALREAECEIATDYTKKKNVLRLKLDDGAEYLFMASTQNEMVEWLSKIQFHAEAAKNMLPPAQQLTQYDPELAHKVLSPADSRDPSAPVVPPSPTSSHSSSVSEGAPRSPRASAPPTSSTPPAAAAAVAGTGARQQQQQQYTHVMGQPVPSHRRAEPEERADDTTDADRRHRVSQTGSSPRSTHSNDQQQADMTAGESDTSLPPLPDSTPPPPLPYNMSPPDVSTPRKPEQTAGGGGYNVPEPIQRHYPPAATATYQQQQYQPQQQQYPPQQQQYPPQQQPQISATSYQPPEPRQYDAGAGAGRRPYSASSEGEEWPHYPAPPRPPLSGASSGASSWQQQPQPRHLVQQQQEQEPPPPLPPRGPPAPPRSRGAPPHLMVMGFTPLSEWQSPSSGAPPPAYAQQPDRPVLRRPQPPTVPQQPLYTNGEPTPSQQQQQQSRHSMPPQQTAPRPVPQHPRPTSTLPPQQAPPHSLDDNANKSTSLDRHQKPTASAPKDEKKKHSVFGGLFKKDKGKKKDK